MTTTTTTKRAADEIADAIPADVKAAAVKRLTLSNTQRENSDRNRWGAIIGLCIAAGYTVTDEGILGDPADGATVTQDAVAQVLGISRGGVSPYVSAARVFGVEPPKAQKVGAMLAGASAVSGGNDEIRELIADGADKAKVQAAKPKPGKRNGGTKTTKRKGAPTIADAAAVLSAYLEAGKVKTLLGKLTAEQRVQIWDAIAELDA